jgi:hypothetical protein
MKNFFAFLLCSFTLIAADSTVSTTAPQTTDGGYELAIRQAYTIHNIKQKISDYTLGTTVSNVLSKPTGLGTNYWSTQDALYHTVNIITTNTTTNVTVTLSRSLDAVNWTPWSTNTITADTVTEATCTGAFMYLHARISHAGATNGSVNVLYYGKR